MRSYFSRTLYSTDEPFTKNTKYMPEYTCVRHPAVIPAVATNQAPHRCGSIATAPPDTFSPVTSQYLIYCLLVATSGAASLEVGATGAAATAIQAGTVTLTTTEAAVSQCLSLPHLGIARCAMEVSGELTTTGALLLHQFSTPAKQLGPSASQKKQEWVKRAGQRLQ